VADVEKSVEVTHVPRKVRADGAVTDLHSLGHDLVTAVDLQPGEQLLASRLVPADHVGRANVPAGLQELTVPLDPSRAVGGTLHAGDTVGVVLSSEPFDLPQTEDQSPNMTHLTFHKVVVTSVQFAEGDGTTNDTSGDNNSNDDNNGDDQASDPAPANQVL